MKKILLAGAIALLFTNFSSAQSHFYGAFGYNLGFAKYDSLNYIIDRYNETRGYLDKQMDNLTFPNGFCLSIGGSNRAFLYDFSWVGRHRTVSAQGTDASNVLVQRDLKLRMNTFNMGMGVVGGNASKFGLGLSFDFGSMKIFTRVAPASEIKSEDFQLIQKELMVSSTFFLHILLGGGQGAGLLLRPYVQLPYWRVDLWETNATINPNTWASDPGYQGVRLTSFGVQIMLALYNSN